MTTRALSLVAMMLVAACSSTPPPARLEAGRDAVARQRGHAGGHQAAVLRRVRRPGARHEGRGADASTYLVDRFKAAGVEPGNPDGTWTQNVPLVGITPSKISPLAVSRGGRTQTFRPRRTGRRVQPACDRCGEPREVGDGVRRLRRAGARVPVGRLQGTRRQGQDARSCSSTIRRSRSTRRSRTS